MYVWLTEKDQQKNKFSFLRRIVSKKRRSLSSSERRDKKPIDVLSLCCATNSNKEKFDDVWWRLAQSWGSTENLTVTTFLFLFRRFVQLYLSKTQIVLRTDFQRQSDDKVSRRRIDWKDQRSFSKGNKKNHFFLLSNIFVWKENSGRIFSFQHAGIDERLFKKNSWDDLSISLQLKKPTNPRWKSNLLYVWLNCETKKIFHTQKSFLLFFDNRFRTKDFQIKHQMKRYSTIKILKIYSKKKNQMDDVRIKDILDKLIFSSSNLFQIRQMFKWWTLFYQWIFHQIRRLNFD